MSKVCALYHIVFSTKHREFTIPNEYRKDVYRFIWYQLRMCDCQLYRIGGVGNHLHLLINLPATARLSDIMRTIKANTSGWLMRDPRFPEFKGWAREYYAMTISPQQEEAVKRYIDNQPQHHSATNLSVEMQSLCAAAGYDFDSRDMTD